ncbi:VirB4 family type IV secretion system protein [Desulfotomaculum nigrificans]|uniref:VirB4 family type IV secretion system protein n=1 Tax=Desulfotomaculum nigrificans TaxID=1565 RepID=UPI0001FAEB26|nr:ATP-binding protein [Desulfotomaculum nigrificans]
MLKLFKKKKTNPPPVKDLTDNTLDIQDLFSPEALEIMRDSLYLGANRYSRIYAVYTLPRQLRVGWLDDLSRAGDIDISIHMHPAPPGQVVNSLLERETQSRSQYILDQQSGNIARIPELEAAIADYRALREAVQLGNDNLYYVTIFIAIHGKDEEELRQRSSLVEDILARKGVLPVALSFRQENALKSCLPLNDLKIMDMARNLTSGAAACCMPLTTSSSGHISGIALGHNIFTGSLVFLDRFAGEHVVSNQHMLICGEPGSGKSVTARLITLLELDLNTKTAYIDPEGEYVYYTEKLGGQVITLMPGRFSGMNILDVEPETIEENGVKIERVNLQEKTAEVVDLIAAVMRYYSGQGLDMRQAALLEEAIMEEYRAKQITEDPESLYSGGIKKNMPTLSDIQARLAQKAGVEDLADAIKPLLAGGSLGMFDGQTTIKLKDVPLICFNLKQVQSDFARFVASYASLAWLWQKFAQRGGKSVKKSVNIDEAWMFLKHPDVAKYLEVLARRGRKHGCALTVITQRFEEFTHTPSGRAIIDSCATILVLKQEEHAADAAVEYFSLASGCRDLLAKAAPGMGILRTSGITSAVQVSPAPFEWPLVETKVVGI